MVRVGGCIGKVVVVVGKLERLLEVCMVMSWLEVCVGVGVLEC